MMGKGGRGEKQGRGGRGKKSGGYEGEEREMGEEERGEGGIQ